MDFLIKNVYPDNLDYTIRAIEKKLRKKYRYKNDEELMPLKYDFPDLFNKLNTVINEKSGEHKFFYINYSTPVTEQDFASGGFFAEYMYDDRKLNEKDILVGDEDSCNYVIDNYRDELRVLFGYKKPYGGKSNKITVIDMD